MKNEERLEREREQRETCQKEQEQAKLMKNVLKITCEKQELRN